MSRLGLLPLPPPLAAADLKNSSCRLIDVDDGTYLRRCCCNIIDTVFPPRPPLLLPPATAKQRGGGPPPRPQALIKGITADEECMMFLFHNRMADPHNDAILLLFIIPLLDCTIKMCFMFLRLGIFSSIYVESNNQLLQVCEIIDLDKTI